MIDPSGSKAGGKSPYQSLSVLGFFNMLQVTKGSAGAILGPHAFLNTWCSQSLQEGRVVCPRPLKLYVGS